MSTESVEGFASKSLGFRMGTIIEAGLANGRSMSEIRDEINLMLWEARVNSEPDGWEWYHYVICLAIVALFAFGIIKFYVTGS